MRIRRTRHGMTRLAGGFADHGEVEHHVGGKQPQIPMRRVLVVDGHRQHQPVKRQHTCVIGHHQRRTIARDVRHH